MLGIGCLGPLGRDGAPDVGGPSRLDDRERDAWIVLSGVSGVGPVSFGRLVAVFGSAGAVLGAACEPGGPARLVAATRDTDGGSPTLAPAAALAVAGAARDPAPWLVPVRRSGVTVLTLADEAYPLRLRRVDLPPPVLFLHGDPAALDRVRAIAVVGTRRPTGAGRATAGEIAEAIARVGATIVSGLAVGIDGAAHAAAVRMGAPTVAVIGGGHERLYPASHRGLARGIVRGGGVVLSEFSPDTIPTRGTFPRRNRIISGLADATVVVEAGARSGALTTAAWALEQGRGLYLVPGRVDDPTVAGCLAFLREAGPEARIVVGVPELLDDLGLVNIDREAPERPAPPSREAVLASVGAFERAIALEVAAGRGTVDELVIATSGTGAAVLGALTALEVRGLVLEAYGRYRAAGALAGGVPIARPQGGLGMPRPRAGGRAA